MLPPQTRPLGKIILRRRRCHLALEAHHFSAEVGLVLEEGGEGEGEAGVEVPELGGGLGFFWGVWEGGLFAGGGRGWELTSSTMVEMPIWSRR